MPIISNFPGGSGTGGGGLALAAATDIKTLTAHEKVYIQWTDPDDLVVAGSTLASWGGTLLVRKAGSMPTSRRDGVIVLDSKTRDAYKTAYFCDGGLTDGTAYYYKLFPYTTANAYTDTEDGEFSATPNAAALGSVSGIEISPAGNGKLAIKWTDPAAAVVSDGVVLATWSSTIVVMKAGGYAESPTDQDAAFTYTSTTRNGHSSTPLIASGLTNKELYYVSLFPTATDGCSSHDPDHDRITATPDRFVIEAVPTQANALTYTGSNQSVSFNHYDSNKCVMSGDSSGTNAGTYHATFTPMDDYMWPDDTIEPKVVDWAIDRATIPAVPVHKNTLIADGTPKSPEWDGYDSSTMTIEGSQTETAAGDYSVSFTPTANYQWWDGSVESKTAIWTITSIIVPIPSQRGALTYTGSNQSPEWDNFDTEHSAVQVSPAKDAGEYSAVFTLLQGMWPDGTTEPKTVNWSIGRASLAAVPQQSGSLTYDGDTKTPSWDANYDSSKMTLSVEAKINAGTDYTAFFTPTANYQWSDGSTAAKTATWSINRAVIANEPSQSYFPTYSGQEITPTWDNYNSAQLSMDGTTSAVNAGSYSVTFYTTSNYQWSDGSYVRNKTWRINKASGSLSLSTSSVTLNASNLTKTVTVTRAGNGTITASSSNTGVATATVSGTTVTIKHVNQTSGTATITVKVAAGTNHTAPANKTVAVTASFLPTKKALNDQTWAEIRRVSDAGKGSEYWNVGDRKGVLVKGTVGTLAVNQTLYVYILGFNHNSAKEGSGIQFGTFKTALSGGTDVCLVDSEYAATNSDGIKNFNLNHWGSSSSPYNTNYGGWKGCDARYDILGSTKTAPSGYGATPTTSRVGYDAPTNTATSPVANTLMAALPSDLRSVMKPITKYTDNKGNSSNVAANVTTSVDYLPLLSEFEIFGARTYANQYEQNSQLQYDYYKAGNSKVKYRHDANAAAPYWWERSPRYSAATGFCIVNTDGTATAGASRISIGLAPAFMV